MASIYQRPPGKNGIYWISFYDPVTGEAVRLSLETADCRKAKRLKSIVEARCLCVAAKTSELPPGLSTALRGLADEGSGLETPDANGRPGEKSETQEGLLLVKAKPQMASIYPRPANDPNPVYWVAVYHPRTGAMIRRSLETKNKEEAERKVRKIEALCQALKTWDVEIPSAILDEIGWTKLMSATGSNRDNPLCQPVPATVPPCTVEAALKSLLSAMYVGNDGHYLDGTMSIARRLFGTKLVNRVDPRPAPPKDRRKAKDRDPAIHVYYLAEITSVMITGFLSQHGFSTDTCRHYKEFIRRLFNHALEAGIYIPANPHAPNPANGLPAFIDTEREIVVLDGEDKLDQMKAIESDWRVVAAVKLMTEVGFRSHEVFALRTNDLLLDLGYIRLRKNAVEGSAGSREISVKGKKITLKRGERAVALDQSTVDFLCEHVTFLQKEGFEWVVPSPAGIRWNANDFGKRLHELNEAAKLPFTAQDFRHTYATDKITEGWPLRVLAQQMGTSVRMLEMHYAGFIPPEALKYTKRTEADSGPGRNAT